MADILYPLKLTPFGVWKPWGGDGLTEHLGKALPPALRDGPPLCNDGSPMGWGESWEVSDNDEGMSYIANGPLEGTSLRRLYREHRERLLGAEHCDDFPERFPLLAKLLDAAGILSVQVHPGEDTARPDFNEEPKTEAWHVIHARQDARLWCGTSPGVTADDLMRSFASSDPLSCLHSFRPEAGQTIFIPARTVHTVRGVVFAEIQQNSATTLRLHDFAGRPVDLERGLDVVDYARGPVEPIPPPPDDRPVATLLECEEFVIRRLLIDGRLNQDTAGATMQILMMLGGEGVLTWRGNEYSLGTGESVLLPATLGEYDLKGELRLLQYYLPRT